jgi:hypothetical protein
VIEPPAGVLDALLIAAPDDTKTLVHFRRLPALTA